MADPRKDVWTTLRPYIKGKVTDAMVAELDGVFDRWGIPRDGADGAAAAPAPPAPVMPSAAPVAPAPTAPVASPGGSAPLAWGARVSPAFRDRVRAISAELGISADDLMSCMAWESGRSFSPSKKNLAGSGATGLIQFMPSTAKGLGTTTDALAAMTAEAQLDWVRKYFLPWKGKLKTLSDLYMAILWPKAVGKPDDFVLFSEGAAYRQNAGLDTNRDHKVTKAECAVKLYAMRAEGLKPENMA